MTVYYMHPVTGNNANDGLTPATAWLTRAYAVTQMSAGGYAYHSGDELRVLGGGAVTIVGSWPYVTKRGLTFAGCNSAGLTPYQQWAGADLTIFNDWPAIESSTTGLGSSTVSIYDWQTLAGFRLVQGGTTENGAYAASSGDQIQVEYCEIDGFLSSGIMRGGSYSCATHCYVHDCMSPSAYAGAIEFGTTTTVDMTVRNCLVVRCNEGIYVRGTGAPGVGSVIESCTVIDCGDGTGAVDNTGGCKMTGHVSHVIRDCIAYNNKMGYGIYNLTGSYENCCSYTSDPLTYHWSGNYYSAPGATCIESDPLFVDVATDDYRLKASSPCVAMASGNALLLADMLGNAWLSPGSIGALQYIPPTDVLPIEAFVDFSWDAPNPLGETLQTSLFCCGRAPIDAVLPIGETTRRGFWHDTYDDYEFGSLLWLIFAEGKLSRATPARVKSEIERSLSWIVTEKLATSVTAYVERNASDSERLDVEIVITRQQGDTTLRFEAEIAAGTIEVY